MWGEAPFLGKFIEEENSYEEMTLRASGKGTGKLNAVITVNTGASPDTLALFLTKTKDRLDCGARGLAPGRPWPLHTVSGARRQPLPPPVFPARPASICLISADTM